MMKLCVCVLAALCLTQVQAANINKTSQTKEVTPKGEYVTIDGQEYYLSDMEDGFINAREAAGVCKDLGMELVSFETEKKWESIKAYLYNHRGVSYWSSGERYDEWFYYIWKWETGPAAGIEVTFTDWSMFSGPGWSVIEPDYDGPETEVCIRVSDAGWKDDPCSSVPSRYMCQRN